MTSALESIDFALLHDVTGGCGKKHCCPAPVQQCQIVMPPAPPPAPLPQAPAPMPVPESSGPTVSTSVSINGQPAA